MNLSSINHSLDLYSWLDKIEMGIYKRAFANEEIFFDTLGMVTSRTLTKMGIRKSEHKSKIMKALKQLTGETDKNGFSSSSSSKGS